MKYCNKCKVNVAGSREKCPLCQTELAVINDDGKIEKFPVIKKKGNKIDKVIYPELGNSVINLRNSNSNQ